MTHVSRNRCSQASGLVDLPAVAICAGVRARGVPLDDVEAAILELSGSYTRAHVVIDPWQAIAMVQRLRARSVSIEEFTFTSASVGRLAVTLAQLIANHELALPPDRELLAELERVKLRESSPGVLRMDHEAGDHDDWAIAIALAAQQLVARSQSRCTIVTAAGRRLSLTPEARASRYRPPPVASPLIRHFWHSRTDT